MNSMNHLPTIAVEFFLVFSRMEFALKRTGHLRDKTPGAKAEPNWDMFAGKLSSEFYVMMRVAGEAKVLFEEPPRHLRVQIDGKSVDMEDVAPPANVSELFLAVRSVRNNLMHGEKPLVDHRSEELLRAGLFVLKSALPRIAAVQEAYDYSNVRSA